MMKVQNNPTASRYELYVDGELTLVLSYYMKPGQMWMLSVDHPATGRIRKYLDGFLKEVFQDVHRRRIEVLPFSPQVRAFMMKNDVYLRLIPATTPGHFPDLRLAAAVANRHTKLGKKLGKARAGKKALGVKLFETKGSRNTRAGNPIQERGKVALAG